MAIVNWNNGIEVISKIDQGPWPRFAGLHNLFLPRLCFSVSFRGYFKSFN